MNGRDSEEISDINDVTVNFDLEEDSSGSSEVGLMSIGLLGTINGMKVTLPGSIRGYLTFIRGAGNSLSVSNININ